MGNSKSCPRCRGNIVVEEDVVGRFEKCLQCGYERDIIRTSSGKNNQAAAKTKMDLD